MESVVLLLGGNIGSMSQVLKGVRADIEREIGEIAVASKEYSTKSWGFKCEADFTNQALEVRTQMLPVELLDVIHSIEEKWGRNRDEEKRAKERSGERYTSRTIDIDIILYGNEIVDSQRLTIPHRLMGEREFVMEPISEILPLRKHPINGLTMAEMLKNLKE